MPHRRAASRDLDQARGALIHELLGHTRPLVLNSARVVELMWRRDGVTVGMRAVLQVLHDRGPSPVPAIAEHLDLARQQVQRHVDDLITLDLAESRPNPRHRRSVLIAQTVGGRDLFTRVRRTELLHLGATMAAECTDDELHTATRVLAALNRDVRERAQALRAES